LAESKEEWSFPWPCPRKKSHSHVEPNGDVSRTQGRCVFPLIVPKEDGLFPLLSLREKDHSLSLTQKRRVITLVVPKEDGLFPLLSLREKDHSLSLTQERRVITLVMPK
jgi:hypothetical protein